MPNPDPELDSVRLLTLREAAGLLTIHYADALSRAHTGRLPGAVKLGGRWKVRLTHLRAWLDKGCPDLPVKVPGMRRR